MILLKKNLLLVVLLLVSACSSIPKNTQNSCAIFEERYLWYKHAKASYEKWGAPIHLQLAFVKKESDFNWLAKPPRRKLFKVIPFKRPSSSFGYSQAVVGTWEQYKKETNSPLATRARFKDSVDFIGWYIHKTNKILRISKKDPYRQYLAYYKGWGDYKNYSKDKKAIIYAKSVKEKSILRNMIRTASEIIDEGQTAEVEVDEFVDQAERKLFEISQNKKRSGFVSTAELASETIKIIDQKIVITVIISKIY